MKGFVFQVLFIVLSTLASADVLGPSFVEQRDLAIALLTAAGEEDDWISLRKNSDGFVRYWCSKNGIDLIGNIRGPESAETRVRAFLAEYGPAFSPRGTSLQFEIVKYETDRESGWRSIRLQEVNNGIPVHLAEAVIQLDPSGRISSFLGNLSPSLDLAGVSFTAGQGDMGANAIMRARDFHAQAHSIEIESVLVVESPKFVICDPRLVKPAPLLCAAWLIKTESPQGGIEFLISDESGETLTEYDYYDYTCATAETAIANGLPANSATAPIEVYDADYGYSTVSPTSCPYPLYTTANYNSPTFSGLTNELGAIVNRALELVSSVENYWYVRHGRDGLPYQNQGQRVKVRIRQSELYSSKLSSTVTAGSSDLPVNTVTLYPPDSDTPFPIRVNGTNYMVNAVNSSTNTLTIAPATSATYTAGTLVQMVRSDCDGYRIAMLSSFWSGEYVSLGLGSEFADDVVGHEYTHAINRKYGPNFSNAASGYPEAGSLNEGFPYVLGELHDIWNGKGRAKSGVSYTETAYDYFYGEDRLYRKQANDPDGLNSELCEWAKNDLAHPVGTSPQGRDPIMAVYNNFNFAAPGLDPHAGGKLLTKFMYLIIEGTALEDPALHADVEEAGEFNGFAFSGIAPGPSIGYQAKAQSVDILFYNTMKNVLSTATFRDVYDEMLFQADSVLGWTSDQVEIIRKAGRATEIVPHGFYLEDNSGNLLFQITMLGDVLYRGSIFENVTSWPPVDTNGTGDLVIRDDTGAELLVVTGSGDVYVKGNIIKDAPLANRIDSAGQADFHIADEENEYICRLDSGTGNFYIKGVYVPFLN